MTQFARKLVDEDFDIDFDQIGDETPRHNTWDDARAMPQRHEITVVIPAQFPWSSADRPRIDFCIATASPRAMVSVQRHNGQRFTHVLTMIYSSPGGPSPEDVAPRVIHQQLDKYNREFRMKLRQAFKDAICKALNTEPDAIKWLERIVKKHTAVTPSDDFV